MRKTANDFRLDTRPAGPATAVPVAGPSLTFMRQAASGSDSHRTRISTLKAAAPFAAFH